MQGFIVVVGALIVLMCGAFLGNVSSTHDVGIKSVLASQEACKNDEGLYMIKSERAKITALCKNGNKFELKEDK